MTPGAHEADDPCRGCGLCCLGFSVPPFDAHELVRASDALLREIETYVSSPRYRAGNPCLWLDLGSGRCKHHEVRPVLCRWFEAGGKACSQLRAGAGL